MKAEFNEEVDKHSVRQMTRGNFLECIGVDLFPGKEMVSGWHATRIGSPNVRLDFPSVSFHRGFGPK